MLTFTVAKPLHVPLTPKGQVNLDELGEFWRKSRGLGKEAGCYIFAVPHPHGAQGLMPLYVGKASASFRQECFAPHKLLRLRDYLDHHAVEHLTLFLVVHPTHHHHGRKNSTAIQELETHLIRLAYNANHHLLNLQNAHGDAWGVRGVTHDGKGKRSQYAIQLRGVLGIDDEDEPASAPAVPNRCLSE